MKPLLQADLGAGLESLARTLAPAAALVITCALALQWAWARRPGKPKQRQRPTRNGDYDPHWRADAWRYLQEQDASLDEALPLAALPLAALPLAVAPLAPLAEADMRGDDRFDPLLPCIDGSCTLLSDPNEELVAEARLTTSSEAITPSTNHPKPKGFGQ